MTVLTGRQIREAWEFLGLKRGVLARKVGGIAGLDILRAEQAEDEAILSAEQAKAIRGRYWRGLKRDLPP